MAQRQVTSPSDGKLDFDDDTLRDIFHNVFSAMAQHQVTSPSDGKLDFDDDTLRAPDTCQTYQSLDIKEVSANSS
ncbi:hypothetical protein ACROYT_G028848 [Oculina patagonica]